MGLLTAPYNNAMRLGQGFNSYTQQICVDDAVLVSPFRAENILTNDGNTMRLTAMLRGKPSAWVKQTEVIADEQQYKEAQETLKAIDEEKKYIQEHTASTSAKGVKELEPDKAPSAPPTLNVPRATTPEPEPKKIEIVPAPSESSAPPALTSEAEPKNVDADVPSMTKSLSTSSSYELVEGNTEPSSTLGSPSPPTEPEKSTMPETVAKKSKRRIKKSTIAAKTLEAMHGTKADAQISAKNTKELETDSGNPVAGEEKLEIESENLGAKEEQTIDQEAEKSEVEAKKSDSTDPAVPLDADNPVPQTHSADLPAEDGPQEKADPNSSDSSNATAAQVAEHTADEGASKKVEGVSKEGSTVAKKEETQLEKEVRLKRAEADRTRARNRLVGHEAAKKAAEAYSRPLMSLEKMIQMEKANRTFGGQRPGITSKNSEKTKVFNIKSSHGVSQTVVYRSHFIDKLSDVADDMGISAALSVTGDSFSVAGRGSFIKTDKFKESDLNYYISVKVINQSINFKDALEFNPLDNIADEDFRNVFGDCFISGFLEGGELNAVISMKILNTSKATDLAIEGSLAVAGEKWGITAEAAFRTAKTNLDLNTETTVQVSWLGGGIIKPPEEPWTIESLTRAATRFPDMVAASPQRTHAILTKYENLRSYMALKPPAITPLDYENASMYTNELMDTFMTYKSVYSRLTSQIASVQSGNLKFKTVDEKERTFAMSEEVASAELEKLTDEQKKARIGYFPSTLDGLDAARQSIRSQMNMIIARVVDITKRPSDVLDQPKERFLSPFSFESLLPPMASAFKPRLGAPLTNERMYSSADTKPGTDSSIEEVYGTMVDGHRLCLVRETAECKKEFKLFKEEVDMIERYLASRDDGVEKFLRLTPLFGNVEKRMGNFFTSLDFVQADFVPSLVRVFMEEGVVVGLMCKYANGLSWKRGKTSVKADAEMTKPALLGLPTNELTQNVSLRMETDERITSVIVTIGAEGNADPALESILGLKFATNKGQQIDVQAVSTRSGFRRRVVGKRAYFNVRTITFESPLERGYLCGFWGRSDETETSYGMFRLGAVWANGAPSNRPDDATGIVKKEKTLDEQLAQQADAVHQAKLDEQVRLKLNEIRALNIKMANLRTMITSEIEKSTAQAGQGADLSTVSEGESEAALLERLIRVKADVFSKAREDDQKTLDAAIAKEKEDAKAKLSEAGKTAEEKLTSEKKAVEESWQTKLTNAGTAAEEKLTSEKKAVEESWQTKLTNAGTVAEEKLRDEKSNAEKKLQREVEETKRKTRAREVISVLRNFRLQLATRLNWAIDCHGGINSKAQISLSHGRVNQTLFMSDIDGESFSLAMDFNGSRWLYVEQMSSDVHKVKFTDRHENVALWTLEVRDDGKYRFYWKNTDFHLTFDGQANEEGSDLLIRKSHSENDWWIMRYLSIR